MVGQAVCAAAEARGCRVVRAGRASASVPIDLTSSDSVRRAILAATPDLVVNAAAMVDLAACEANPADAHAINSAGVRTLAAAATASGARFVQVSTDQFWSGDGDALHDEDAPVRPVNVYGASKLEGERAALEVGDSLILRTNVTGHRGWPGRPTFAEWLCGAIDAGEPLTLFDDYYTSTIDSGAFADALLDLAECGASGIVNVAARGACHKAEFADELGRTLGKVPKVAGRTSVRTLSPRRAESAGLDCRMAEALLGRKMPDLGAVCKALSRQIVFGSRMPQVEA